MGGVHRNISAIAKTATAAAPAQSTRWRSRRRVVLARNAAIAAAWTWWYASTGGSARGPALRSSDSMSSVSFCMVVLIRNGRRRAS